MANRLPNEDQLFEKIKSENITVDPVIWDLLYNRIGDDISAINLLIQCYYLADEPIPVREAQKILLYTRHIKEIINQVTVTSQDEFLFPEFINSVPLHPIVREMFTHYIGNDVYIINLIVQDAADPVAPTPVSLENAKKMLDRTRAIREFMDRLREATSR